MSGDSLSNDDADFLDDSISDDDFVVEDIVGKNDDLEDLFDSPASPAESTDVAAESPQSQEDHEDDALFTDHTEGIKPTEEFAKPSFSEDGPNQWDGENLDLESVGVPDGNIEQEEQAADPQIDEAKESFAAELDSMLQEEEDFGVDADEELELVDRSEFGDRSGEIDDGISEFEQSGPFVLDDGEGLWSDDSEAEAEAAPTEQLEAAASAPEEFAPGEFEPAASEQVEPEPEAAGQDAVTLESLGLDPGLAADPNTQQFELGAPAADLDAEQAGDEAYDGVDSMPLLDAAAAGGNGDQEGEAGWEPLPAKSMDELSEVDEVQRTDDDDGYGEGEGYADDTYDEQGYEDEAVGEESGAAGGWSAAEQDLDDVDGHDIYADEEGDDRAVVLGGPGSRRSRTVSLLLSVAASFVVVFGAAAVVVRPEWFGLSVAPERVAKVEILRPSVSLAVTEPPSMDAPAAQAPNTQAPNTQAPDTQAPDATPTAGPEGGEGATSGATGTNNADPATGDPATVTDGDAPDSNPVSDGGAAGRGQSDAKDPSQAGTANRPDSQPNGAGEPEPGNQQAAGQAAPDADAGTDANAGAAATIVQAPTVDGAQGGSSKPNSGGNTPDEAWPVVRTNKEAPVVAKAPELARFGDGLLVGELNQDGGRNKGMIDGVMPGSRAFAQLHNGNYFIGQVKQVADTTITLRVEAGEVTLATGDIAQLTRLGSSDYDELQKATKGFVRLTNNNRLVGGILSRIADDHVVLEFRSNRVMLPKSAIGEIVSGDRDESKVRLDTTTEEDSWIRQMVKREIGTGQGAEAEEGGSQLQSSRASSLPSGPRPSGNAKPASPARSGPPR